MKWNRFNKWKEKWRLGKRLHFFKTKKFFFKKKKSAIRVTFPLCSRGPFSRLDAHLYWFIFKLQSKHHAAYFLLLQLHWLTHFTQHVDLTLLLPPLPAQGWNDDEQWRSAACSSPQAAENGLLTHLLPLCLILTFSTIIVMKNLTNWWNSSSWNLRTQYLPKKKVIGDTWKEPLYCGFFLYLYCENHWPHNVIIYQNVSLRLSFHFSNPYYPQESGVICVLWATW